MWLLGVILIKAYPWTWLINMYYTLSRPDVPIMSLLVKLKQTSPDLLCLTLMINSLRLLFTVKLGNKYCNGSVCIPFSKTSYFVYDTVTYTIFSFLESNMYICWWFFYIILFGLFSFTPSHITYFSKSSSPVLYL